MARGLDPLPKETEEEASAVHCEYCVEKMDLPPSTRAVPFSNPRIDRIVRLIKNNDIICANCNEQVSAVRCNSCAASMCSTCATTTHSAPMFQKHQLSPIDRTDLIRALPKCKSHPLNNLEFFCTADEIGVCQVCLLKGQFVGKPYTMVSELKEKRAENIHEKIAHVKAQRLRLASARDDAVAVASELDTNLLAQKKAVQENFQAIRDALNSREDATLGALTAQKDAKLRVLQSQITTITQAITKLDTAREEGDVVLKYSNDLEYVYNSFVIEEYMQDVAKIDASVSSS